MELMPFQKRAVIEVERRQGRALLALDMGLGKTAIALTYLKRNPDALPAVVVCPAAVKYQWQREAERWWGVTPTVLESKSKGEQRVCGPLVVVNYDILESRLEELMEYSPKTVIVDECHYIANPRAKRSKAVRKLAYRRSHVLALSGTPLLNRPIELFNSLQMLWPWEWKSRWDFAQRYCNPRWTPWGWKFDGASNIGELHRRLLESGMIRYRKRDVLPELPEKVREVVPLPLEDVGEYERAACDFLQWLSEIDPEAAFRAKRAEAVTRIGYLLRLSARLKSRYAVEWINQLLKEDADSKMVVFAVHRGMLQALQSGIESKSVMVDGSVTGRDRQKAVDQFQGDRSVRVFIGQLSAAGFGLNLTAADTVVFTEMDWVPARFVQAEDRVHRIGQKKTAWCYYLVAKGTVEEKLCEVVQSKQLTVSNVLDGRESNEDLDVYRLLLEKVSHTGEEESLLQSIQPEE